MGHGPIDLRHACVSSHMSQLAGGSRTLSEAAEQRLARKMVKFASTGSEEHTSCWMTSLKEAADDLNVKTEFIINMEVIELRLPAWVLLPGLRFTTTGEDRRRIDRTPATLSFNKNTGFVTVDSSPDLDFHVAQEAQKLDRYYFALQAEDAKTISVLEESILPIFKRHLRMTPMPTFKDEKGILAFVSGLPCGTLSRLNKQQPQQPTQQQHGRPDDHQTSQEQQQQQQQQQPHAARRRHDGDSGGGDDDGVCGVGVGNCAGKAGGGVGNAGNAAGGGVSNAHAGRTPKFKLPESPEFKTAETVQAFSAWLNIQPETVSTASGSAGAPGAWSMDQDGDCGWKRYLREKVSRHLSGEGEETGT